MSQIPRLWKEQRGVRALIAGLVLVSAVGACAAPQPGSASGPVAGSGRVANGLDQRIEERAQAILRGAAQAEPQTTKTLSALVAGTSSWLHKLEHRLKSRESLVRKLRLMHETAKVPVESLWVSDSLRFMLVTPDEPPGAYVASARRILAALEAAGHRVRSVKNYWARGDNYSAVNCELDTPEGFPWELQFQTPESLETNLKTRAQYEELRASETPAARKRAIFDSMTEAWREVPIPSGALEPGAIHPRQELKDRRAPGPN